MPCPHLRGPFGQEKKSAALFAKKENSRSTCSRKFPVALARRIRTFSCQLTENDITLTTEPLGPLPEQRKLCSTWTLRGVGALGFDKGEHPCGVLHHETRLSTSRKFNSSGAAVWCTHSAVPTRGPVGSPTSNSALRCQRNLSSHRQY